MAIKTKLIFLSILIVLVPLLISHLLVYSQNTASATQEIFHHLVSVAQYQSQRLKYEISHNKERLALVASRTQLRLSLEKFLENPQEKYQLKMNKILKDAKASIASFESISVMSLEGVIVASTNEKMIGTNVSGMKAFNLGKIDARADILFIENKEMWLHLAGPLKLNQRKIGVLVILARPDAIISIVTDYSGLNQSGEIMLAQKNHQGDAVFLTPLRFDAEAALNRTTARSEKHRTIIQALNQKDAFLENTRDYRDKPVLAVSRNLKEPGWVMVAKIDQDEAFSSIHRLRTLLIQVLTVSILVVLAFSFLFARSIVSPLKKLTQLAANIGNGVFSLRSELSQHDELGQLGAEIDLMAGKLEKSQTKLRAEIEQRKTTQKALETSEAKYRAMMEAMKDPAYICNSDFRIEYMNPAMIQRTGKDVTGQLCYQVLHGQGQQCDWCMFDRVHNGERFEQQILSPKDQKIYHVAHSPIRHVDGSVSKMAVYRDITELKQAEANAVQAEKRFRDLFESISDLIYTQDMEGRFLSANPAMQKLFGYSEQEFLGRKAAQFMKPEFQLYFKTMYLDELKAHGYHEGITSYYKKDGSKIYIDYRSSIVTPPDGTPYISGMGKDVTDKVRSDRKMKQLEAQIVQSQKMETIGTLAGGIAHDFNNILFPILGHTEMLLSDVPEDDPMHNSLNKIYTGGMRAAALVKQILTFSRQGASKVQKIKIQPIVKEAVNLIRSTIPTSIIIKQKVEKDAIFIKADPTQIHQVVMNLATNAYQAMEESGGELSVTLEKVLISEVIDPEMKPGEFACLAIADTGAGMDSQTIQKIFDPFFTTKALGKGTGMGLSVVHGIVKSNNGFIQVTSTPGKGSMFKIYFPHIKTQEEPSIPLTRPVAKAGTERIMIVDDEEAIVYMTQQMLERLGYTVETHTSSINALKVFEKNMNAYDMVISDLAMPLMSGDQLASELLKIKPDIPILLCTGFSEKITAENAAALGIKGLLMKPIIMTELSEKIRQVLDE